MLCAKCGAETRTLETRWVAEKFATRRRLVCTRDSKHRLTTWEIPARAYSAAQVSINRSTSRTLSDLAKLQRNRAMLHDAQTLSTAALAARYELALSTVRDILKKARDDAAHNP
jgi:transcriptional regulator NrdR family protein